MAQNALSNEGKGLKTAIIVLSVIALVIIGLIVFLLLKKSKEDETKSQDTEAAAEITEVSTQSKISETRVDDEKNGEEEYKEKDDKIIPSDAFEWNGHYYYIYENEYSWVVANNYCVTLGGHLVTINDEGEQKALFDYIKSNSESGTVFWIGFKANENGVWEWITGEPAYYTNWAEGEPDNYNGVQPYGSICYGEFSGDGYNIKPGDWDDRGDESPKEILHKYFICEWE